MSIYNAAGEELTGAFATGGTALENAYDKAGNIIYSKQWGRTILFEDDFDSFDSSMWVKEYGIVRNYNVESQCYRQENVSIENSCLVLTAKREPYGGKPWTSGSISGQTLQSFKFGRFEAKIKFPNIAGAFGAFWMLGSNFWKDYVDGGRPTNHGIMWPECGEVDIVEGAPGGASNVQSILWASNNGASLGLYKSGAVNQGGWNIYALEWTQDYMASYVNGVEYARWTFSEFSTDQVSAYQLPFYIILNLAVGSSSGTPASSTNEMKMYVDWVRVYAPLT